MLQIGEMGWNQNVAGYESYAATLDPGDDFWDELEAKDDDGDRAWYRALALALRESQPSWLRPDGRLKSLNQSTIGSCVGNGWAKAKAYRASIERFVLGQSERVPAMVCVEWEYYAARKMGGMLGRGDGATGFGAAKACEAMGTFFYGMLPSVDAYTVRRCRDWGDGRGIPQEAHALAAQHKHASFLRVNTARKAWLAAGFGYPFALCSGVGFEGRRDEEGVIRPRGRWMHCMTGGAARRTTSSGRRLILIDQSWGDDWTQGPYVGDMPAGSFYADLDVVGDMARVGDTFAGVDFEGLPEERLSDPSFTNM